MTDREDVPDIPGYISVKEAAKRIKASLSRTYAFARQGRFHLFKAGGTYMIPEEEVTHFKRNPTGRLRKQPPNWRVYHGISEVFATEMRAWVREGQQEHLVTKLNRMLDEQQHRLTGSIARYVVRDRDDPDLISVWLIWKNTELPDQEIHDQQKQAFMDELADVLDWEHAEIREKEGIIYT